jgi:hypothetical protein
MRRNRFGKRDWADSLNVGANVWAIARMSVGAHDQGMNHDERTAQLLATPDEERRFELLAGFVTEDPDGASAEGGRLLASADPEERELGADLLFAGSIEMWDIERQVRGRAAVASGDPRGADAVPEPRVVGDFGETPGFVYRQHLESVIGQGAPPTSLLRRILLG